MDIQIKLLKSLEQIKLEIDRNLPENQGAIFHYTTTDGLLGILRNDELWASHISFLNDTFELVYTRNLTLEVINQLHRTNQISSKFKELVHSVANDLESRDRVFTPELYVFSTSLDGDSLPLWMQYSGVSGYNIALDWWCFQQLFESEGLPFHFTYGRVEYQESKQMEVLTKDLLKIHELWRDFIDDGLGTLLADEHIQSYLKWRIEYYSVFMKHPTFQQEREFRCVFSPLDTDDIPSGEEPKIIIDHRSRNGLILPYMKVSIDRSPWPEKKLPERRIKLPIQSITMGPALRLDSAKRGMEHLFYSCGHKGPVLESGIPPLRF
jgi:hypothetical protein